MRNVRSCGAGGGPREAAAPASAGSAGPAAIVWAFDGGSAEQIDALRDQPVRVVVTAADAHGQALPTAANARVERFVPHGVVLEHAAAVVCHGGMGIVQKSIAAGVPLVVVPFGRPPGERP